MAIKNIKVLTMVRNDIFLRKWVEYYGAHLGKENLHIYFDGTDQEIPSFCEGTNTRLCEKLQGNVVANDRQRSRFLSAEAARLFSEGADIVIATDADEFIVVDPSRNISLAEYLSCLPKRPCWSGLGIDVLQHLPTEGAIDFSRPFLEQRHRGWLHARYTKPSIMMSPGVWGGGFHRVKGKNYHIAPDLYLFHFGGVDLEKLRDISADSARASWSRHQLKRLRAIEKVSAVPTSPWQPAVNRSRWFQKWCRLPYAPNKPTTFNVIRVVEIPERFRKII